MSRQLNIRVADDVHTLFAREAKRSNLTLTDWLVQAGLMMAGRTVLAEQLARVDPRRKKSAKKLVANGRSRR